MDIKAWAFAGPVQNYGVNEPITTYLNWFQANQASFDKRKHRQSAKSKLLPAVLLTGLYRRD